MGSLPSRASAAIAAVLLAAACSQPAPKPPPPAATPKLGVVVLVQEVKHRGITQDNWRGYFGKFFSNETDASISQVQYEVTVSYDDGTTGTVTVDQKPAVQPGQKVRITGTQVDPIRR
ncbi:MAG: hypothetical protein ACM36B_08735 [Bacteroidota bacterium]